MPLLNAFLREQNDGSPTNWNDCDQEPAEKIKSQEYTQDRSMPNAQSKFRIMTQGENNDIMKEN